jgi:hypothetical protein
MRELITIKKGIQRACLYGLGVPGLLGPSPPAKSKLPSPRIIMVIIHKTTLFQRFVSKWNVAAVVEIRIEFHM